LRLPPGVDEEGFVLGLLREKGVLVHPGFFFEFQQSPYVVVSLLIREEEFRKGMGLLWDRTQAGAENTC